jgi:hypothetical protein
MAEPQFVIADMGREVGILNTKKNEIAIFYGSDPHELKRRLEWAESGLNSGEVTARDFVWSKFNPAPTLGQIEGES